MARHSKRRGFQFVNGLAEASGRKARAGQLVRLLDVPAERGKEFGVFDNGGPDGDAATLAKAINRAATTAYGAAGPAFVRKLISDSVTGDDVRGLVDQFVQATIPADADGQVERAAQRFMIPTPRQKLPEILADFQSRHGEAPRFAQKGREIALARCRMGR